MNKRPATIFVTGLILFCKRGELLSGNRFRLSLFLCADSFLWSGCSFFATGAELLNLTRSVDKLFFAGVEGVALVADFHV